MPIVARHKHSFAQVAAYGVSGGAFFVSGYLAFALADKGFGWSLFWAKLFSYIVGLLINYVLQHYWVFAAKKQDIKLGHTAWRYAILTTVNYFIDYGIIRYLKGYGISPYAGQFVSSGFFCLWNYFWYKYWVFYHPKAGKAVPKLSRRVLKEA